MDWSKMPAPVRELRIAYVVPEVRKDILAAFGWSLIKWACLPFNLVTILPINFIGLVAENIATASERLCDRMPDPFSWAKRKRQTIIFDVHQKFAPEELRRRAFGKGEA